MTHPAGLLNRIFTCIRKIINHKYSIVCRQHCNYFIQMNKTPDYLLLDAARMGRFFNIFREKDGHYNCLYEDRSRDDLSDVAPYLVSVAADKDLLSWVTENGFGKSWGIFIYTAAGFEEVLGHFRKFLVVKTASGSEQYFRFYDPRVLKIFLPTCDKEQLTDFFGPVEKFIVEGDNPDSAIDFSFENAALQQHRFNTAEILGKPADAVAGETTPFAKKKTRIIIDDHLPEPGK